MWIVILFFLRLLLVFGVAAHFARLVILCQLFSAQPLISAMLLFTLVNAILFYLVVPYSISLKSWRSFN